MKIRALALTLIVLSTATTIAVASRPAVPPLTLADVVGHMESNYPGEVVAIQFDVSGDKRPHYHVDMRFPASGLARVDIDATTLAMASRDVASLTAGSATLADAAALIATQIPGQVVVAELDAFEGMAPHYDVDVRLPQGAVARLKVDPATLQIAWRNPAIVDE
jgi:uncharacterized membrane protein YkoI